MNKKIVITIIILIIFCLSVFGHRLIDNRLLLPEITTPSTVDDFGQVYTKSNNELYFKDGAGVEHLVPMQLTTITDADTPFVLADEAYLVGDTTNSAITVNLPSAATVPGRMYWIKNSGAVANNVTIDANGSELIDEVLTVTLIDKEAVTIVSDGSNWHVM